MNKDKQTIINTIQKQLARTKTLTLADIFLLGWAIGKRLYIFDPSCNGIQDNTSIRFPGMGLKVHSPLNISNFLSLNDNKINTPEHSPPQSQESQSSFGGKKRNTKRKNSINNTKKQNKKYTRRTRST